MQTMIEDDDYWGPMRLGDAAEWLHRPPACACSGPSPICHCQQISIEARQLQRGAHIMAKLLVDAGRLR